MFFKRGKRGQARAIDFVVSISLFLLVTSQLFLIIITSTSPFTTTSEKQTLEEKAELLANNLITSPGTPQDWGFNLSSQTPFTIFGLGKASNTPEIQVLDASKIARLDPRLATNPLATALNIYHIDYSQAHSSLGLDISFKLQILPLINLNIASSTNTSFIAKVTDYNNNPLENITLENYIVHPNGSVTSNWQSNTNSSGINETLINLPDDGAYVYASIAQYAGFADLATKIILHNTEDQAITQEILLSFATEANKTNECYVALAVPSEASSITANTTILPLKPGDTSSPPITLNQKAGSPEIYEAKTQYLSVDTPSMIISRASYQKDGSYEYRLSITTMPLTLRQNSPENAPYAPPYNDVVEPETQTVTIERTVIIRNTIYKLVLTCWQ
ncbi:MAG: hypothetical protein Q6362_009775 [Candidatus Wukongarchaeota archaeon]|nr:hypothetical protein [Candidatus Wukongarchaeota archaeon]